MNGGQDLGGMHGFGPIAPEVDEPRFRVAWEKRVFGLAMAMGYTGAWNLDASRSAREALPPDEYLTSSYYAIWLKALEHQVQTYGLAKPEELSTGMVSAAAAPVKRVLMCEDVAPLFALGFPSDRPVPDPARFCVNDRVRARRINPTGHTRLPRYVRGYLGTVEAVHGGFVFPDTNARLAGEAPQWLYTVRFSGRDLWGEQADADHTVSVDAFESYLESADPESAT